MSQIARSFRPARTSADVLVIGTGLAGLTAAISARKLGADVLLVGRGKCGSSSDTAVASGGLAIGVNRASDDSPALHAQDTKKSGQGLSESAIVDAVTSAAPSALDRMIAAGAVFARLPDGTIDFRPIPGHSRPRSIRCAGGGTANLITPLLRQLDNLEVRFLENAFVNRLHVSPLASGSRARGAEIIDELTGEQTVVQAGAVILAAGGLGYIYEHTSNDPAILGSSYALALMAGCAVVDLEFMQFTPTALVYPEFAVGLSPGGALMAHPGVALRNVRGDRFMWRYDAKNGENTTRDVLSRAIYREVAEGRGTQYGGVYLDLSATNPEAISDVSGRFLRAMDAGGFDPFTEMVHVAPEAHFAMGGVVVDETTATEVAGLFAAGEAAGGLHGANRLNSNALTEAATTGHRAAISAVTFQRSNEMALKERQEVSEEQAVSAVAQEAAEERAGQVTTALRRLMTAAAGVERDAAGLEAALERLAALAQDVTTLPDSVTRKALQHQLLTAEAVVRAALVRNESRGSHFRSDYPQADPEQMTHIVTTFRQGRGLVHTRVAPGQLAELVRRSCIS